MKKFLLLLLLLLISSALTSCHTTHYIPMPSSHARDSVHSDLHKIVNNTIIRDSMAIRFATGIAIPPGIAIPSGIAGQAERSGISGPSPDTVFIDRWHIEIRDRVVENTDTLRIIARDSIPYPVEVQSPPRRKPLLPFHREDAPRFYRTCTLGFFLLLLALLAYIAIRFYLHR